jgi:hypothetical protein
VPHNRGWDLDNAGIWTDHRPSDLLRRPDSTTRVVEELKERVELRRNVLEQLGELRRVNILSGSLAVLGHREVRHREELLFFMRQLEHGARWTSCRRIVGSASPSF